MMNEREQLEDRIYALIVQAQNTPVDSREKVMKKVSELSVEYHKKFSEHFDSEKVFRRHTTEQVERYRWGN